MKSYETVFVLQPGLEEEARNAILERVRSIIEAAGTVEEVDEWGLRKLAYEIAKKYKEGYYVLVTFKAEKSVLDDLNHYYRITDSFIRDIIVCREK
jgi:small subunit ribosomal protein S6